jgi:hypothetical protein
MVEYVFQVILIYFNIIFTESETFQQMDQTILESNSDSIENYFLRELKHF